MENFKHNGYVPTAVLVSKTIDDLRDHIEYEKFIARMLIDNDDTRQFKKNTEEHNDSLYKFIYNNKRMDELTMRGKYDKIGKSKYRPNTEKQEDINE
jgi:predicted metal-dependent phosphotriesterase family hydrolase